MAGNDTNLSVNRNKIPKYLWLKLIIISLFLVIVIAGNIILKISKNKHTQKTTGIVKNAPQVLRDQALSEGAKGIVTK